ncbi:hypothetical protein B0H14DRAFT_2627369 [Mycena olivaceomarginata]|nr:hypothetical protein B0H14DRAFT_2627369 [Mycena olivaceomarginata]
MYTACFTQRALCDTPHLQPFSIRPSSYPAFRASSMSSLKHAARQSQSHTKRGHDEGQQRDSLNLLSLPSCKDSVEHAVLTIGERGQGHTYEYGVCLQTPTLRKLDERDRVRKAEEKNAQRRLQASGRGTDTDMGYVSSQQRRSAGSPPKMIGRRAARVHPPLREGAKAVGGRVRAKPSWPKQAVGRGPREAWQKKTQTQDELKTYALARAEALTVEARAACIRRTMNDVWALEYSEPQRIIFEIAALSHLITTPNLMLIAWRVELLLYRVLSSVRVKHTRYPAFPSARLKFCSKSSRKSRHFFNKFAESELKTVLTACIRVTNLVSLYSSGEPLAGFRCLQRFTIDVDAFLTSLQLALFQPAHPVHHILGSGSGESVPSQITARFVCIEQKIGLQEIWLHGKDLGQDYWARAGAFIIARRSGKVDREHAVWFLLVTVIHASVGGQYSIADNDDLWNV